MRHDKIYTPEWLVKQMLDLAEYTGEQMWNKTILEPSFGEGSFLVEIVHRIIEYGKLNNKTDIEIYESLSKIYGIEIDKSSYDITLKKLHNILIENDLEYDSWNLYCDNTLIYNFNMKFDYIFGNPPYVRIHNMSNKEREVLENYSFCDGMTNMYIVFIELCLDLLNLNGKMVFVTPNTFFYNKSQQVFRNFLCETGLLKTLVNYGTIDVFNGIGTYVTVSYFYNSDKRNSNLHYVEMLNKSTKKYERDIELESLENKEFIIHDEEDERFLSILYNKKHKLKDYCTVLNAIQTNSNSVYVGDFKNKLEDGILRDVIKGSDLGKKQGKVDLIFPYEKEDGTYKVIKEDVLKEKYPLCYKYLLSYKNQLDKRKASSNNTEWYQYGRSQGIASMENTKIVLKKYISLQDVHCELLRLDKEVYVHSGIFIIAKSDELLDKVYNILVSEDFCKYCKLTGKYLTGGYKEITGSIISSYPVD